MPLEIIVGLITGACWYKGLKYWYVPCIVFFIALITSTWICIAGEVFEQNKEIKSVILTIQWYFIVIMYLWSLYVMYYNWNSK